MQILNFVAKRGPGGKRNRAARRRKERRQVHMRVSESTETLVVPEVVVDLAGSWDESVAKKALEMFSVSGKSKRAFASEHNFPESRLRSWEKKFALLTIN